MNGGVARVCRGTGCLLANSVTPPDRIFFAIVAADPPL